jgi:hypothetical protein
MGLCILFKDSCSDVPECYLFEESAVFEKLHLAVQNGSRHRKLLHNKGHCDLCKPRSRSRPVWVTKVEGAKICWLCSSDGSDKKCILNYDWEMLGWTSLSKPNIREDNIKMDLT